MEHDDFYKSAGISREQLWIQRGPPVTGAPDLAIVSIETNDPAQTLKEFATSNHSWAVKFREFANKAYGVDFTGPPPPLNENIVDWQHSVSLVTEQPDGYSTPRDCQTLEKAKGRCF